MTVEKIKLFTHLTHFRNPEMTNEIIFGHNSPQVPRPGHENMEIVHHIIKYYPEVRAVFAIPFLLHRESYQLPPHEKMGLLCFTALTMEADRIIDTNLLRGISLDQMKTSLLAACMLNSKFTIEDLMNATLGFFPSQKRQTVEKFLTDMLEYNAKEGFGVPGTYNFSQALNYRKTTDNYWIQTTYEIAGIVDAQSLEEMKHIGIAVQFRDDLRDWSVDWSQNSFNLLIGLCNETCPEEFSKMGPSIDAVGKDSSEKQKRAAREWVKIHAPRTYMLYRNLYTDKLKDIREMPVRIALRLKGF